MAEENLVANPQIATTQPTTQPVVTTNPKSVPTSNFPKGNKGGLVKKIVALVILLAVIAGVLYFGRVYWQTWQLTQRDSKRKTDIQALQEDLETFKGKTKDKKYYPGALTSDAMVKTGIIAKIPQDPINKQPFIYIYQSLPATCLGDCTQYALYACLENKNDKQGIDPVYPCTIKSYKVTSPQGS